METRTLTFTKEKDTKNTGRYAEQSNGAPPILGTIYVQKWALGNPAPETLEVTITAK